MLPHVHGLFTFVRDLARESEVTEIAATPWFVQRHGLAPLAARSQPALYREDLVRSSVRWARITNALAPILPRLDELGLHVAPIKGLAYATTLYRQPAERPMSDIDLLVAAGDIEPVSNLLARDGFRPETAPRLHHAAPWSREGLIIDVHRSIVGPGRGNIDLAGVWTRAKREAGAPTVRLDPVDAFAFHLLHMARNRLRGPLIHVVDAGRMLARGPADLAEQASERATSWQLGSAVRLALRFVHAVLGEPEDRPIGRIGPTLDDVALFNVPGTVHKLAFDVATAGSLKQLAARALAFGANALSR